MMEAFFGFKKTPFSDSPDAKQLFASQAWTQVKARLQFLVEHHGTGLLTGEVGSGKSTAARTFTASLNPNLYKSCTCTGAPGRPWICSANWPWN
jgi:general secretion pathway protein A